MKKEYIYNACIWYRDLPTQKQLPNNIDKGIVVSGINHAQCLSTANALTGKKMFRLGYSEQGFLTSHNRFVDRKEALKIALENEQVLYKHGSQNILFSEDLLYYES